MIQRVVIRCVLKMVSAVLDVGRRFTKVGAVDEGRPRGIFATPSTIRRALQTREETVASLAADALVQRCGALVPGFECCCLLRGPELSETFVAALKCHLTRIGIEFLTASCFAGTLESLGIACGVVLDIGHASTRACVCLHGVDVPRTLCTSSRGSRSVCAALQAQILKDNTVDRRVANALTEEVLEDAIVRAGSLSSPQAEIPVVVKRDVLRSRPSAAVATLFAPGDDDLADPVDVAPGASLQRLIAEALMACDRTQLPDAIRSVACTGGLAAVPGLMQRVAAETLLLIERDPCYARLKPRLSDLRQALCVHTHKQQGLSRALVGVVEGLSE